MGQTLRVPLAAVKAEDPATALITAGNVDLFKQPKVPNPDGTTSTVDSRSFNFDGKEVLLPSVTPDGRHLTTDNEIVAEYKKTGRHLGMFRDVASANAYAKQLHDEYAAGKYDKPPAVTAPLSALAADRPAEPAPSVLNQAVDATGTYLKEALAGFNPVTINKAIQATFWHPIDTAKGILSAQDQVRHDAMQAFHKGDYAKGSAKFVEWLIPLIGPRMSQSADYAEHGDWAKALGAGTDAGLQIAVPKMLKELPNMRVAANMRPRNAVAAEAVAFGERQGIPLDAGTATGSSVVQTLQKRASDSLGGAGVAEDFKLRQADRLATIGEQQAARAYPTGPVSPEQAGQAVRDAVTGKVKDFHTEASTQYDRLRAIEADPARTASMQIDLTATRDALRPIYLRLKREAELVPLQGGKARALTALDRIINGFDAAVPLSIVDEALGDLKALARGAEIPELRTQGQGVAAEAVKVLDQQVRQTAARAGGDVLSALENGRKATTQKYLAADVLDKISAEPVQAFNQATFRKDAGIAQLRKVAALAPDELPKIGRAYLDDLISTATAEGGFTRADGLFAKWESLGPETKKLLFTNPGHVADLDRFFQLAKIIAKNPNPSGTARVLTAFNVGGSLVSYPLAKLFYSRRGVQLMTKGLQIPIGNSAGRAAWTAEVTRAVGETVPAGRLPAAADQEATAQGTP